MGPGVYENSKAFPKRFSVPMASAFGANTNRKLDNTDANVVKNPGPGAYSPDIALTKKF